MLFLNLDPISYGGRWQYSIPDFSPAITHAGDRSLFSRLTRLEISKPISQGSFLPMPSVLPRLSLVHFGVDKESSSLLAKVNLGPLKSLSVRSLGDKDLVHLCRAISLPSQIESLTLGSISVTRHLMAVLEVFPFRRLYLDNMRTSTLLKVLPHMNLSQLQVLTLSLSQFSSSIDDILATRCAEFMDGAEIQVVDRGEKWADLAFTNGSWTWRTSGEKLAYQNIHVISYATYQREYHASILPLSSR